MAFNPLKITIPSDCIIPKNTKIALLEVAPLPEYVNGVKTDKHIGYKYLVVELGTYEKFHVKVTNLSNPIPPSVIAEAKGPVYVTLHDCYAKLYIDASGNLALSFTANAITLDKQ